MDKEIERIEKKLETEKNLDKITFYEGYLKGLKFQEKKKKEKERFNDTGIPTSLEYL